MEKRKRQVEDLAQKKDQNPHSNTTHNHFHNTSFLFKTNKQTNSSPSWSCSIILPKWLCRPRPCYKRWKSLGFPPLLPACRSLSFDSSGFLLPLPKSNRLGDSCLAVPFSHWPHLPLWLPLPTTHMDITKYLNLQPKFQTGFPDCKCQRDRDLCLFVQWFMFTLWHMASAQ